MTYRPDSYDVEYYGRARPRKIQDDLDNLDEAERRRRSTIQVQAQPVATSQPITDVQARDYERRLGKYLASTEGHERVEAQFTSDYANFQKSPEYQEWKLGSRAAQEEYTGLAEKTIGRAGMDIPAKAFSQIPDRYQLKPGSPFYDVRKGVSDFFSSAEARIEGGIDWLRQGSKSHLKTSKELQAKGDVWGALGHSTAGMFGRLFTGGAETLTFPFRPIQWANLATLPFNLADEYKRSQIVTSFQSDLGGNIMEISGGVVLGYAGAKGLGSVLNKLRGPQIVEVPKVQELMAPADEGFFSRYGSQLYPESVSIKEELGSGFLSEHLYSKGGSWRPSGSLAFGKVKSYVQTGEGLIPVSEPVTGGKLTTVWFLKNFKTPPIFQDVRTPWTLESSWASVPRSASSLGIYGALSGLASALAGLNRPVLKAPQPPLLRSPSAVKVSPYIDQLRLQRLRDIAITGQVQIPAVIQVPIPAPPRIIQRHRQRQTQPQIQIPEPIQAPHPPGFRPPPGPIPQPPPERKKTRLPNFEGPYTGARSSRLRGLAGYEQRNYQVRTPGQVLRALIGGSRK